MLNTGQMWTSMKSTTSPERPGPRNARSARFPSAPPRTSPIATACHVGRARKAATISRPHTTRLAAAKNHGASVKTENAPPVFVA